MARASVTVIAGLPRSPRSASARKWRALTALAYATTFWIRVSFGSGAGISASSAARVRIPARSRARCTARPSSAWATARRCRTSPSSSPGQ